MKNLELLEKLVKTYFFVKIFRDPAKSPNLFATSRVSEKGISDQIKVQIFKPFYTIKITDMRIGLATCQKFVQAHNKIISVKSEKGRGSTFIIKLPMNCKM